MLKLKWKLEEKSVEVVGHFYTEGVNLKAKPFLKEETGFSIKWYSAVFTSFYIFSPTF